MLNTYSGALLYMHGETLYQGMWAMELDTRTLQRISKIKERAALFQQKGKEWKHCGEWIRCLRDSGCRELTLQGLEGQDTYLPYWAGVTNGKVIT